MYHKIISVVLVIILLLLPSFNASELNEETNDYRPEYSFGYSAFEKLKPFPKDFFEVKSLVATQDVLVSQLNDSYYQPELLPNWEYWSEKAYSEDSLSFGSYGVFIYPSRYDVYNVKEGMIFNISAIVYSHFGIQKYQGVKLTVSHNDSIDVTFTTPTEILLKPTYPYFHNGWMQLIEMEVYVKENTSSVIEIKERKPDNDNQWKQTYGNNYTSGSSLFSQITPKCTINLYRVPPPVPPPVEEDNEESIFGFTLIMIFASITLIMIFIVLSIKNGYGKTREKER
jgi:hypothetical protein